MNKQQYEQHLNETYPVYQDFMAYLCTNKKGRVNDHVKRKLNAGQYGTVLKNLDFKKFEADFKACKNES